MLVTGPTPVPVDSVRRLTNKFTGRLGVEIAVELYRRGADALLVLAGVAATHPTYLPCRPAATFDDYVNVVHEELGRMQARAAIFSAAVADYRPEAVLPGKTPSGGALETVRLVPTPKVIEGVRRAFPTAHNHLQIPGRRQPRAAARHRQGRLAGLRRGRRQPGRETRAWPASRWPTW